MEPQNLLALLVRNSKYVQCKGWYLAAHMNWCGNLSGCSYPTKNLIRFNTKPFFSSFFQAASRFTWMNLEPIFTALGDVLLRGHQPTPAPLRTNLTRSLIGPNDQGPRTKPLTQTAQGGKPTRRGTGSHRPAWRGGRGMGARRGSERPESAWSQNSRQVTM